MQAIWEEYANDKSASYGDILAKVRFRLAVFLLWKTFQDESRSVKFFADFLTALVFYCSVRFF